MNAGLTLCFTLLSAFLLFCMSFIVTVTVTGNGTVTIPNVNISASSASAVGIRNPFLPACLPVVPGPTNKRPTWHTPRRPTVTTAVYRAQARDWAWVLAHSFSITHRRRQPACWWRHLRRATFTQAWGIRPWAEPWLLVSTVPDYLIIYCNLCPLPVCSFAFARLLSFSLWPS